MSLKGDCIRSIRSIAQTLEAIDHQLVPLVADYCIDRAHGAHDRFNRTTKIGDDGGDLGNLLGC